MGGSEERALAFAREAAMGAPGSIRDVADYLLNEGTGIHSLTMGQVAARTYTSKSTLVRFAQMAGYAGWTAYRHDFLVSVTNLENSRTAKMAVDVNHPFERATARGEVIASLARIHQLAVQEVERAVSSELLDQCAQALLQARNVVVLAVMQNRSRGQVFASNLGLMGILCHVPASDEAVALGRQLHTGDCVVAISYSGDLSHMPLNVVKTLSEKGITIIAITNSERSPLSELADHTVGFAPLEHLHDKVGAFYSGACTSFALDLLYASCYAKQYEQSASSRNKVLQGLEGLIPQDFSHV